MTKGIEDAWAFREVDPVPATVWFDWPTHQRFTAHYGGTSWLNKVQNPIDRLVLNWQPTRSLAHGEYLDVYGSRWRSGSTPHVVRPALTDPALAGFELPDFRSFLADSKSLSPADSGQALPVLSWADIQSRLSAEPKRALTVVGYGAGILQSAFACRGYEDFLADLILEPSFAESLLAYLTERQLELLEAIIELPCDGVLINDDYGDQRGIAIGAERWRQLVKPYLAQLYARIRAAGKWVFHHSCGNVLEIVPDLIDCGLDVLQSLQPEAMDVYRLKRDYGNRLRLWGGLGTQQLLPNGTPEDIRREADRLRHELGRNGGFCLSTSKPIMAEVPIENAVACFEALTRDST